MKEDINVIDESKIDRSSKVEKRETVFNGSYGFVIRPDSETQQMAESLANRLFPDAEYKTTVPHITLYHGRVENLPIEAVRAILSRLKENNGKDIDLKQIEIYGGKFAFWNSEVVSDLRLMHEQALGMAEYLDSGAAQRAVEERLNLTEKELSNVKKFGHPLVGELYKPHITLAYDNKGLKLAAEKFIEPWKTKIDDVLFTEMGKYGSVVNVINIK